MKVIKKIPTTEEIKQMRPLSDSTRAQVERDRQEVKDIMTGKDNRLLIVVGPCSAWPDTAVLEYAKRLKELQGQVEDKMKLVLRTYIQKPRTTKGWKGPMNQPDPLTNPDIAEGLRYARNLMVDVVELGVPIADEALFIHNAAPFIELLSYVAVGARSTQNQEHRMFASAQSIPVGMKNPTSGDVKVGVHSVIAAQHGHAAVFEGHEVMTFGNPFAHTILRGGLLSGPNYHIESIYLAKKLMEEHAVQNPAVIIDASHDNCRINGGKDHKQQIVVIKETLENLKQHEELKPFVRGFMIESFIKEGKQKVDPGNPDDVDRGGLSITDPCLSWEQTAELLLDLAKEV